MWLVVLVLVLAWSSQPSLGRKHSLSIEQDRRHFIPLSTFGFYTGGKLRVNMTRFRIPDMDLTHPDKELVVGFSIDKTVSDALNPYVQATETQCILNKLLAEKEKAGILRFTLDFAAGKIRIKCSKNIRSITILESDNHEAELSMGPLSDSQIFRPKRSLRDPDAGFSLEAAFQNPLDRDIAEYYGKMSSSSLSSSSTQPTKLSNALEATKASVVSKASNVSEALEVSKASVVSQASEVPKPKTKTTAKIVMKKEDLKVDITTSAPVVTKAEVVETETNDDDTCEDMDIPLRIDSDGFYQTSFVIYIRDAKQEGLYSMFFHNCYNYVHKSSKFSYSD